MLKAKRILCTALAMLMSIQCSVLSAWAANDGAVQSGDELIFSTDFDGYQIGSGEYVSSAYDRSSSTYAEGRIVKADGNHPESSYGVKVDEEHGTSLLFDGYDCDGWPSLVSNFSPAVTNERILISYDLLMKDPPATDTGTFAMFGPDSALHINFSTSADGTTIEHGEYTQENAYTSGEWTKVELYMDLANREYVLYVGGNKIG